MGIQINGITDTISATDGGLAVSGQQLTGVTDINASGIVTATQGYVVGTGASIFSPAANTLALGTNGSERIRITSAGFMGLGMASPSAPLDVVTGSSGAIFRYSSASTWLHLLPGDANGNIALRFRANSGNAPDLLFQNDAGTEIARITNSGRLAIGTTSPSEAFTLGSGNAQITGGQLAVGVLGTSGLQFINNGTFGTVDSNPLVFRTAATERARIDTSGRLLVGTSSARSVGGQSHLVQFESANSSPFSGLSIVGNSNDSNGSYLILGKSRGTSAGSNTVIQNNDQIGGIFFAAADGNGINGSAGRITCEIDGTPGANDLPGRLVFSTTADGASSPTERMRIGNGGLTSIGGVYTFTTGNAANVNVDSSGYLQRSTSSIKYKTDVETLDDQYADALLACRPVWYRSTCEHDCPEHSYWGFIAEEVASIDPRLVHWKTTEITHDKNGAVVSTPCTPEPEGVQYERFVPHLLNLIKRQQQAIETLEAKVAALESA